MWSGYLDLPVLAFIAAVLVLIPLPRQIRARNIASIAMILWFFQHCLVDGINAIVWAGNVRDSAPVSCEISKTFSNLLFTVRIVY
jgi:pheromone a factor receptor